MSVIHTSDVFSFVISYVIKHKQFHTFSFNYFTLTRTLMQVYIKRIFQRQYPIIYRDILLITPE